jgi:hypothetical protein
MVFDTNRNVVEKLVSSKSEYSLVTAEDDCSYYNKSLVYSPEVLSILLMNQSNISYLNYQKDTVLLDDTYYIKNVNITNNKANLNIFGFGDLYILYYNLGLSYEKDWFTFYENNYNFGSFVTELGASYYGYALAYTGSIFGKGTSLLFGYKQSFIDKYKGNIISHSIKFGLSYQDYEYSREEILEPTYYEFKRDFKPAVCYSLNYNDPISYWNYGGSIGWNYGYFYLTFNLGFSF